MLLGVVAERVFVAAENADCVAADTEAGAGVPAFINRVAYRAIGRARALGSHIAFRSEARHQVVTRRERRSDGALRHGFLHRLQVFGAGMKEEMDVSIN